MTKESPKGKVRWRHPRLASALGRFEAYGPGPFELITVVDGNSRVVVKTEFGEREIDAVWLDLDLPSTSGKAALPSAA